MLNTFLFSLFVFVSAAVQYFRILTGQYFSLWTGPDQYNVFFRFCPNSFFVLDIQLQKYVVDDRFACIEHSVTNSSWRFEPNDSLWTGPYDILWVTSRSISCHMTLSAMNYLINRIRT
jgi:hypothetical protein